VRGFERRAMSMAKSLPNRVSTRLSTRRQPSPLSQVGASDMPMCRPFFNFILRLLAVAGWGREAG
jgi:hypothetical protein